MCGLVFVFAVTLLQTTLLAGDMSGSRPAGALAASCVLLSPAVFVGGYHLYPDADAVAVVPWLARHAWPGGPPLRPARVAALGLVAGGLVWLHVKLLLLGAVSTVLLAMRLRRPRSLALLAASALTPSAAWLLFQYHLTGLLRPDALYVRFGSEVWSETSHGLAWRFVGGLGNALFGARDGLFVMAPAVVVVSMGANPRRTVNPYRGLTGEAELRRALAAGRSDPAGAFLDLSLSGLLLAVIGFWAARFSRKTRTSAPEGASTL